MSNPVKNVHYTSYSPRVSGDVATGEIQNIRGGGRSAVIFSGGLAPSVLCVPGGLVSGNSVMIWSGAGRLNSILPHTQLQSGLPAYFYDSAAVAPSGVSVSGQWLIGVLPPTWTAGQAAGVSSGNLNVPTGQPWNGQPINLDAPFQSGLCVSAPSGAPGFTISFTPANPNFGNTAFNGGL